MNYVNLEIVYLVILSFWLVEIAIKTQYFVQNLLHLPKYCVTITKTKKAGGAIENE